MKDFFRYDTMEGRKSLLNRARNVALTALQQYDLAWEPSSIFNCRIRLLTKLKHVHLILICFGFIPIVGVRKKYNQNLYFFNP